MKTIHNKYLGEIKDDIDGKWVNRERLVIDLRVLKNWHIEEWEKMNNQSLYNEIIKKFIENGFIEADCQLYTQLLNSKVSF